MHAWVDDLEIMEIRVYATCVGDVSLDWSETKSGSELGAETLWMEFQGAARLKFRARFPRKRNNTE